MHYVYILYDPVNMRFYFGQTADLKRRIKEHNRSKLGNYKLIYYEAFMSKSDAIKREYSLKRYGSASASIKKRTFNSQKEILNGWERRTGE